MHALAVSALRTIRRHQLFTRGSRLLAAVSGGADSVAMLLLLRELHDAGELVCAGVAHVNHGLRATAARDEAFCAALASQLNLPIEIGTVDVAALARQRRTSKENAARVGRYACLRAAMERLGADRVAVAHTRDDQAETFLLHAIRGAGTRGLRGIHPRRGVFVRPLLDVGRQDLRAYLHERGMPFCHDETNDDVTMLRNRIRGELMPLLVDRFSPGIVRVLARNADVASADEAFLAGLAGDLLARTSRREAHGISIEAAALAAAPDALAWRVALEALRAVRADAASIDEPSASIATPAPPRLGFQHAQALVELARGRFPRVDLPGVRAERIGTRLVLQKRDGRRPPRFGNSFTYALSIPGEVHLQESGCAILAWRASVPEAGELVRMPAAPGDRNTAVVSAASLSDGLIVRNRRPGDTFRPFGLAGRKKLQDFFVDRKVGRDRRDLIPLVVDRRDRIVWVAGHEISEEFRVTDRAQAVVILRLKTFFEAVGTSAADGVRSKA